MFWGETNMTTFLPKEVTDGLEVARKQALRKKSRLRVQAGLETLTVLKYWDVGFSVDLEDAPKLRGLVDLYDGSIHLYQCLIVASEEEDSEMRYEFKRNTLAVESAPLDFERAENAPVALIGRS
tara:strand:+ start:125 stop:496 length:372 start_codon:yes stop_codon:yes gene_type:complete